MIDKFFDSGNIVIFLFVINNLWGPYISCQFLSFLNDIFIKGANKVIIFVDMKWIDHKVIEYNPIEIYFLLLNERNIPIISPVSKVIKMRFLYKLGKNKICSGLITHSNNDPIIIAIGLMIIMGMFE